MGNSITFKQNQKMLSNNHISALLAICMSAVQAEIVDNAFWQSSLHNWTNGSLKIVNGV